MKRKVAVYKAKGDILSAITELTKLLEMYVLHYINMYYTILICTTLY